jgi:hypothetical protein
MTMDFRVIRLASASDGIEIAAVRARAFDGLLLRVKSQRDRSAPLVLAIGGMGASGNYDMFPAGAAFKPSECRGNQPTFADNTLALSGKAGTLMATGSVPLRFMTADPAAVAKGPKALLEAPLENDVVSALTAEWPKSGDLYFVLSLDAADSAGIAAFRAAPAKVFADAVENNRQLASTIEIDTPDAYLNAALPSAVLGFEAAWNAPTFRHGAIAWHDSFAGWRSTYAASPCGWHDRVQSHMHAFYTRQTAEGRIPSKLENDSIYNMGEVLVDQALYDYEWTGNLDPLRKGGFDAISRHLAWGEKHMKTPDGLYENFLNAWNTDFTDTTSMYIRNVVEGLFGIRMNAPDGSVTLQPGFPLDWDKASIRCPAVAYRYTWDGGTETMVIQSPQQLRPTIRLRARRAEISGVSVNGKAAEYMIEPGVGCCWVIVSAPPGVGTQVRVNYGKEGLRTVLPNGRSWWERHSKHGIRTDTSLLAAAAGRFVTDNGIPFDIPATSLDSVFTTRYENFPNRIEIPVGKRGRKVCVLVAASAERTQWFREGPLRHVHPLGRLCRARRRVEKWRDDQGHRRVDHALPQDPRGEIQILRAGIHRREIRSGTPGPNSRKGRA